jgi:hypothetical protein
VEDRLSLAESRCAALASAHCELTDESAFAIAMMAWRHGDKLSKRVPPRLLDAGCFYALATHNVLLGIPINVARSIR